MLPVRRRPTPSLSSTLSPTSSSSSYMPSTLTSATEAVTVVGRLTPPLIDFDDDAVAEADRAGRLPRALGAGVGLGKGVGGGPTPSDKLKALLGQMNDDVRTARPTPRTRDLLDADSHAGSQGESQSPPTPPPRIHAMRARTEPRHVPSRAAALHASTSASLPSGPAAAEPAHASPPRKPSALEAFIAARPRAKDRAPAASASVPRSPPQQPSPARPLRASPDRSPPTRSTPPGKRQTPRRLRLVDTSMLSPDPSPDLLRATPRRTTIDEPPDNSALFAAGIEGDGRELDVEDEVPWENDGYGDTEDGYGDGDAPEGYQSLGARGERSATVRPASPDVSRHTPVASRVYVRHRPYDADTSLPPVPQPSSDESDVDAEAGERRRAGLFRPSPRLSQSPRFERSVALPTRAQHGAPRDTSARDESPRDRSARDESRSFTSVRDRPDQAESSRAARGSPAKLPGLGDRRERPTPPRQHAQTPPKPSPHRVRETPPKPLPHMVRETPPRSTLRDTPPRVSLTHEAQRATPPRRPDTLAAPTPKPPGAWYTPSAKSSAVRFSPLRNEVDDTGDFSIHRIRLSPHKPKVQEDEAVVDDGDADRSWTARLSKAVSLPKASRAVSEAMPALALASRKSAEARQHAEQARQAWVEALAALPAAGVAHGAQAAKAGWGWANWALWVGVEVVLVWGVFRVTLDYASSTAYLSALDPLSARAAIDALAVPLPRAVSAFVLPHRSVDWSADERKLQAAYDDVQANKPKAASATVERWLKKHPKSQPALVLRMVVLEKQGAPISAVLKAYTDVERTLPLSGRSMWYAALTLGAIARADLVLDMYQRAWDGRPELGELGEMVFLHAAGMGKADAMVAASRKLFNMTKQPVWARLAAYSAWYSVSPAPSSSTPFPFSPPKSLLAPTLLLRASGPPTTASHLYLALQVALGSGDFKAAAALVETDAHGGSLDRQWTVMAAIDELSRRGWEWADGWAWARAVRALNQGEAQRNYAFYRHLLRCLAAASTPERTAQTVDVLTKLHADIGRRERAPFLALLELDVTAGTMGDAWEAKVEEYWAAWGATGGVVTELEGVCGDDERKKETVLRLMRDAAKAQYTDLKGYLRLVNAETYLLRSTTLTPTVHLARRLWDLYAAGLPYGAKLPKTDVQPADQVGLMAVHVLLAAWHADRTADDTWATAAVCAQHVLARSPASQQAHFLLVSVYRLLAAPTLALNHLADLKLSEIQLDTLAFVGIERAGVEAWLLGGDAEAQWRKVVKDSGKMYRRSASELPEYIKQAFENESYSKINGIRQLVDALDRSLAQRILHIEDAAYDTLRGRELSERALGALNRGLAADPVDSRNYELAPEVRGLPGLAAIAGYVQPDWARAMAHLHLRVARFVQGEKGVPGGQRPDVEALSAAERAAFEAVETMLAAAQGEAPTSVADVFKRSVELCQAVAGTVEPYLVLVQLVKTAEAMLRRVAELVKPVKGKKKDVALGQFRDDLSKALEAVKAGELAVDLSELSVVDAFKDAVDGDTQRLNEARKVFAARISAALK
ncbi:mitochondrial distribution and morphology [Cryptotrichosporon argae]